MTKKKKSKAYQRGYLDGQEDAKKKIDAKISQRTQASVRTNAGNVYLFRSTVKAKEGESDGDG